MAGFFLLMIWYPVFPSGNGGLTSAVCTFPVLSVALTTILLLPWGAVGVNSAAHRTQVYFESGSLILADFQVTPPSVLTSTFDIPRSPAKAIPATGTLCPGTIFIFSNSKFLNLSLIAA